MSHMLGNTKKGALLHALGHPALGWAVASLLALSLIQLGLGFELSVLIGGIVGGLVWPFVQEGVFDLKLFTLPVGQDQLIDFTNYLPIVAVALALVGGPANYLAALVIVLGAVAAEYSRGVYR